MTLVVLLVVLLLLASYMVIFQPAYEPESPDYREYALESGTVAECEDGSYVLKTEQGDVALSPEIAQDLLADGFRIDNYNTLEVPNP